MASTDMAQKPVAATDPTVSPSAAADDPTMCQVASSLNVDSKRPEDFKGEVQTTNELPRPELLKKIEGYMVLDKHGKTHPFRSLYTGPNVPRRVLVIFIRHFFCGNCQDYVRTVAESITPETLLALPVSTFITVIGCGDPRLIDMYAQATGCPFPIYTDPKGQIFSELGMTKTLAPGEKPAYMKRGMLSGALTSIGQGLRQVTNGLALKSGDHRQVGGEFLFEPLDISTPIKTPPGVEEGKGLDAGLMGEEGKTSHDGEHMMETKQVSWCHRMKTTRDHAEVPELMEVLGLDGHGKPIEDRELWRKALETRKGKGSSLADEMSKLKEASK